MPTKGKKRASVLVAALQDASPLKESPSKKIRADPIYAGIISTLQGAEDLNEHCREMLVAMTVPSLSTPKSNRHDLQQLGIRMIGEVLKEHQSKLIEIAAGAQTELSDLEGSKSVLLQSLDDAKVFLEKQQKAKAAAEAAHVEAKSAVLCQSVRLSEATDLQRKSDESLSALEKEKADLDTAYLEHFKTPMDASEGPHHSFLKPFLDNLGLEESLISALPSSCVKTKEQRGGFDDLVLAQLEKALLSKIATLEKSLVDEASAAADRKSVTVSAESTLQDKQVAEKTAAAALEAARVAEVEAQEGVDKASNEWIAFEPRVKEATDKLGLHNATRGEFEEGPLKNFENLLDKESPAFVEEAATAGA